MPTRVREKYVLDFSRVLLTRRNITPRKKRQQARKLYKRLDSAGRPRIIERFCYIIYLFFFYIFVKTWSTRRGSVGDVSAAAPDSLAAKYNATTTTDGDRREGVSSLQRQSSSQDRTRERNPLRGSPHRGVLGVGVRGAGGPLRTSVYNIACFRVSLCAHCNAHNVIKYNTHAECTLSNARVHFRYFWSLPPLCFFFFFSYILRSFRYIRLVRLCTPPRRYSFCLSKIGRARLPFLLSRPRRVF